MIGILFATEMEAQPFLSSSNRRDLLVDISGMGMEAAALATHRLLDQGVSCVINAGVCGALNDSFCRGDVFRISTVFVEDFLKEEEIEKEGVRLVSVAQPLFDKERRERLSRRADLVDMEGFAVAQICKKKNADCFLIKGVTDFGDQNGSVDIQEHIQWVSERVADAVLVLIEAFRGAGKC